MNLSSHRYIIFRFLHTKAAIQRGYSLSIPVHGRRESLKV